MGTSHYGDNRQEMRVHGNPNYAHITYKLDTLAYSVVAYPPICPPTPPPHTHTCTVPTRQNLMSSSIDFSFDISKNQFVSCMNTVYDFTSPPQFALPSAPIWNYAHPHTLISNINFTRSDKLLLLVGRGSIIFLLCQLKTMPSRKMQMTIYTRI